MPRIAYYAHHHGCGHLARAAAVLRHVRADATVFTSAPPDALGALGDVARVVRLAPDAPPPPGDVTAGGAFHYAPVGHEGVRERMAALAAWAARGPGALVADVSAEVALLGRLLSLPVVVVRQHGERTDAPHRAAYAAAHTIWAPFSDALATAPREQYERTVYTGGFSRLEGRDRGTRAEQNHVVVIGGAGGNAVGSGAAWTADDVAAAAEASPGWRWTVLGRTAPPAWPTPTVRWLGWQDDPAPVLRSASVVVSAAGHNGVMDAAAVGRPLVVFPEARPFYEQRDKARALVRVGAAFAPGQWPAPSAWPGLLARAVRQDTAPLRALVDGWGAQRAAALLDRIATEAAGAAHTVGDGAVAGWPQPAPARNAHAMVSRAPSTSSAAGSRKTVAISASGDQAR